ncbi:MAG: UDP-N-acetylmuramoyl-L-alanyl-D-glutamate--2,6-diaminopimelate ligase [Caedibacter sp. 37-49]|nr:MAG: UDP-N-acetylmuramoyl-L-alanyl-D-glutamate--2,6-diaminopimelate ligase [Caedibacter sp. 37-49]
MKRLIDFLTPEEVRGKPVPASLLFKTFRDDSRQVQEQDLFLVIPSLSAASNEPYVLEAIQKGASIILIPQGMHLSFDLLSLIENRKIAVFEVLDSRLMASSLASRLFPSQPNIIAGITGTNGKTSVTSFTRQLWELLGEKSASIGTLGVQGKDLGKNELHNLSFSTPEPLVLYPLLEQLAHNGINHLAMEVSSHGLDMYRAEHVHFKVAAFTNLSHEHLDYHKTMEAYFQAKVRLFKEVLSLDGTAVVNTNTVFGQEIAKVCAQRGLRLVTLGREKSDIYVKNIVTEARGSRIAFQAFGKNYTIFLPLIGQFQVENVLTAFAISVSTGMPCEQAVKALEKLQGVNGRMELVGKTKTGASVIVDYAHKPLALETVLKSLRAHVQGQIIVIFGCGGNRDQAKRKMMGEIAKDYADSIIVTDDNPRFEDPQAIRKQILEGVPEAYEIASREEAIAFALHKAEAGDICLIAGKGHEEGQTIGAITYPFCDRDVAQKILMKMEGNNG